jgi:ribosomal protein S18 acetylase RimI-like enzyme
MRGGLSIPRRRLSKAPPPCAARIGKAANRYNEKMQAPEKEFPGSDFIIRFFLPEDQAAAKALILDGLQERWNALDPFKNPDLENIAVSFAGGVFRVAVLDGMIAGTGALRPFQDDTAEICRMSVARSLRRRGIGSAILRVLLADARSAGYRRIILETTSTWEDAVAFYRKHGFRVTHCEEGDTYFLLEPRPGSASMV